MGISELVYFLLGLGDEDIRVTSLAENERDEGDMHRGKDAADAAHFCKKSKKAKPRSEDLEEEVEARRHDANGNGKQRTFGNHGRKPEV